MKRLYSLILASVLAACVPPAAPAIQPVNASYPDLGTAPELVGDTWLNTVSPLRLTDLRGKVVLLDMWTFG